MGHVSQAFEGVARMSGFENAPSTGDKDFGFMRDNTLYEVYEDLLARVAMHERYFCPRIHGKRLVLCRASCYFFRKDMAIFGDMRLAAIWITEWMWFERIVVCAIAMNSFVLAMPASYNPEDAGQGSRDFVAACDMFSTALFTVECVLKIIARGFIFSDGAPDPAYLREPLNWLDFVVVVSSLLEAMVMSADSGSSVFVLVRSFRILRPLRSIQQLPHLRLIITSLSESGHLLGHWLMMQGFFFIVLAILGNNLFSTVSWQQCRLTEQPMMLNGSLAWAIDPDQPRLCGGRYECQPQADGSPTWCGSPVTRDEGVLYDYDPWSEVNNNPLVDYGYNGFQTFQSSLLTVFQVSTMDGWARVLYRYQDAGGTILAVLLFTGVVLIGGFLLMNLVVAILWERLMATIHRERLKSSKYKLEKNYPVDDDIKAMPLITLVRAVTNLDQRIEQNDRFSLLDSDLDDNVTKKTGPPKGAGRNICYTICINPLFSNFYLILIILNCTILGMDSYPSFNEDLARTFEEMNVFFTMLFSVEVCIKMAGLGVDFVADQMNLFDLSIVIISLLEFSSSGETSMSALRTARLLRIFRLISRDVQVRLLLRVLVKAVVPTYNYLILVFLVIYCLALLGLQLFFVRDTDASGLGFYDLMWSGVTVFTLLIGNDWFQNMVLFARKGGADPATTIAYVLVSYVVCNLILKNLFLGIFVAVFSQAREEMIYEYRKRMMIHRHGEPPKVEEIEIAPLAALNTEPEEVVASPRWSEDVLGRRLLFMWQSHLDDGYHYAMDSLMPEAMETAAQLIPEVHARPDILNQYVSRKTNASEMNVLRMLRVKQDASGRRSAVGEALNFKQEEEGWRLPEILEYRPPEDDDELPKRSVQINDKATVMRSKSATGRGRRNSPGVQESVGVSGVPALANSPEQPRGTRQPGDERATMFMSGSSLADGEPFNLGNMKGDFGSMAELDFSQDTAAAQKGGKVLQKEARLGCAPPPLVLEIPATPSSAPPSARPAPAPAPAPAARYRSAWSAQKQRVPLLRLDLDVELGEQGRAASGGSDLKSPRPAAAESSCDSLAGFGNSSGYFSDNFSSGVRQRRPLLALTSPQASFRELVRQAKARLDAEAAAEQVQVRAETPSRRPARPELPAEPGEETRCDPHPCWERGFEERDFEERDFEAPERSASRRQPEGLFAAPPDPSLRDEPSSPSRVAGTMRGTAIATVNKDLEEGEEEKDEESKKRKVWEENEMGLDGLDGEGGMGGVRGIVESPGFDPFILFLIVLCSVCLAVESPTLDQSTRLYLVLSIVEKVSIFFFILEMVLKIRAYGGMRAKPGLPEGSPEPYFRTGWNWIDFTVVVFGIIDIVVSTVVGSTDDSSFSVTRAFRVLRVLRPLRLVTKYKGIRNTVEAVITAVPTLINLVMICLLFYFGWGILFVNLMKGALWHCSLDPTGVLRPDIELRKDCEAAGGEWVNSRFNFDHIGNSLATLLHTSTGDGWIEVMLACTNSQGIGHQPVKNESFQLGLLVMIFVSVSNFFVMNLFIGVLVDHYVVAKDMINGEDNLTLEDKRWKDMQKNIFLTPKLLDSKHVVLPGKRFLLVRQWLQWTIESRSFEGMIILVIMGNTFLLIQANPLQSTEARQLQDLMSVIFVIFFNLEAGLKIFVYWTNYFRKGWDYFDFVVVVGSDLSVLANLANLGMFAQLLNGFRVCRVLRLARWVSDLRVMVQTVWTILPGLFNIVCLLLLVVFMYACLGVNIFGAVADGEFLNHNANFHDFGSAVLLLLRTSTGERWDQLMYDVATDTANCTHVFQKVEDLNRDGYKGCGSLLAYPYFISYVLVVGVILMNLIVAVVLDGFSNVHQFEVLSIFRVQVADLVKAWRLRDYPWTGFLELDVVVHEILMELPPPVGFQGYRRKHVLHQMRFIRLHDGKLVHFKDVVGLCAKRAYIWMTHGPEREVLDVKFDPASSDKWSKFFDVPYVVDGSAGSPYPPRDPEGNDLVIAHIIIAAHVIRFVAKKKKEWKLRALRKKISEEEAVRARRIAITTGASSRLKIPGAGVGALDGEEMMELADPEPPSMLLTQTEIKRPVQPIHLSPLPWPPEFALPKVKAKEVKTKEASTWSSAVQMAKVQKSDNSPSNMEASNMVGRRGSSQFINTAVRQGSKDRGAAENIIAEARTKRVARRPTADLRANSMGGAGIANSMEGADGEEPRAGSKLGAKAERLRPPALSIG